MKKLAAVVLISLLTSCGSEEIENNNSTEKENKQSELLNVKRKEGQKIVQESFHALSTQLKTALKDSGVSYALQFCNTAAYPITDSLSEAHSVSIKRTALNYRNPNNAPTPTEESLLAHFQSLIQDKKEPGDTLLVGEDGSYSYYTPIIMMKNCLKCHGQPGVQIAENDFETINRLYPEDRAINFKTGDLRGMWVVRWAP